MGIFFSVFTLLSIKALRYLPTRGNYYINHFFIDRVRRILSILLFFILLIRIISSNIFWNHPPCCSLWILRSQEGESVPPLPLHHLRLHHLRRRKHQLHQGLHQLGG